MAVNDRQRRSGSGRQPVRVAAPAPAPAGRQAARAVVGPRLAVNPIACDAHGICAELLPEMVHLDEWGYPVIDDRPIPPHLEALARRAVAACPTLALLIRDPGPAPRRPD